MIRKLFITIFSLTLVQHIVSAQNWDNVMYMSNKVGWGENEKFRHTAEFQSRYNEDFGSLESWHLEYVFTYLKSEHLELVPDFRFTRKTGKTEFRPGLGGIYKILYEKSQLLHQVKWQYDKESTGYSSNGVRYGIFYNRAINEKIIASALAGGLFEFGKDFTGFLGLRTGIGAAYILNQAHSINAGYFYGLLNDGTNHYNHIGIFSFQLIINIDKDYKYVPAKYINF